ncbi:hypothetical protein O6H91_13G007600 [Diphasiastrum complanatum]|nr:hypothetical protein O6H91_13G007600 [Diphasiastrum complanatum]
MVPACSIPKDGCNIVFKSSVNEGSCRQWPSDPCLLSTKHSSAGVSLSLFVPSVWKMSYSGLAQVAPRWTNSSISPLGGYRSTNNVEMRRCNYACKAAVEVGGAQAVKEHKIEVKKGSIVKVKGPLKVYHVPKVPEFDIGGLEGEVKEVLGEWKERSLSANLPYKVQFFVQIDGRQVKFVAHLKDGEFEVVE